ncbi:hypothetical protein GLOIN_2v1781048 [Rhizophagus irregularis DAOM 181602=DAOM 197198]|nr:hypothetical protein GLOIN_2v1781048 [Rhizophagus irregularis DAOM 181602=DAOM 197198]
MSIRTKGIMFLSQNITIDSAYLLEYSDIKQSLMNNKAEYLDGTNLIQNPKVQRLRPPPVTNEPISYKGRFTVWRSTMYIEHWIPVPGTNNSNGRQHTPRSTPALPILHWTFYS